MKEHTVKKKTNKRTNEILFIYVKPKHKVFAKSKAIGKGITYSNYIDSLIAADMKRSRPRAA